MLKKCSQDKSVREKQDWGKREAKPRLDFWQIRMENKNKSDPTGNTGM